MRVEDLSFGFTELLLAIAGDKLAWQTVEELAIHFRVGPELIEDALGELDAKGWICPWELPTGLAVTFTPLAAELLCLRIAEFGPREEPRWVGVGTDDPPLPSAKRIFRDWATLSLVIDPSPGPAELAELAEAEPVKRRKQPEFPGAWPDERREAERARRARRRRKAKKRSKRGCKV